MYTITSFILVQHTYIIRIEISTLYTADAFTVFYLLNDSWISLDNVIIYQFSAYSLTTALISHIEDYYTRIEHNM